MGCEASPSLRPHPAEELGLLDSVNTQIGKLHLVDRDGVLLRLAIGCGDGA